MKEPVSIIFDGDIINGTTDNLNTIYLELELLPDNNDNELLLASINLDGIVYNNLSSTDNETSIIITSEPIIVEEKIIVMLEKEKSINVIMKNDDQFILIKKQRT